jgi:hypothetical protein
MMSSEDKIKAEMIINDVLRMIDEQYIYKKINQPIEKAALNFCYTQPETITHAAFNDIVCDFLIHLFNNGYSRKISSKTIAMAEAVSIIEIGYHGSRNGYDAAFLDVMNPEINGLEIVLHQTKEIIISVLRSNYIKWVYDTSITPLEWSIKTIIAEILLDQWKPFLPLNMRQIVPAQMVDCIPDLINEIQISNDKVIKLTSEEN